MPEAKRVRCQSIDWIPNSKINRFCNTAINHSLQENKKLVQIVLFWFLVFPFLCYSLTHFPLVVSCSVLVICVWLTDDIQIRQIACHPRFWDTGNVGFSICDVRKHVIKFSLHYAVRRKLEGKEKFCGLSQLENRFNFR